MPDEKRFHRIRLLPDERSLGWVPYAWLIYLGSFFVEPVLSSRGAGYWAVTIAGTLAFLPSYFRGYWERGSRLIAIVAFQMALGIGFSPINTGASVFFVYAASFAGQLDRPKDAVRLLGVIALIGGGLAWLIDAPIYYWLGAVVFAPLIGGVNLHFRQVERSNAVLRRAHAEIERLAAVAERERIARDLHDVLGHTLSLIILKSQLASKLAGRDANRAVREIREVEQVARAAMAEVRETIRGYRPTFDNEIVRARTLLETAGIKGEFAVEQAGRHPPTDEVLGFVLREGVTNVVRHSGASVCRVRVDESNDGCTLTISDDGRGIGLVEGSGVRGMRERVNAAGGILAYREGSGTRLTVTLPLPVGVFGMQPMRDESRRAG